MAGAPTTDEFYTPYHTRLDEAAEHVEEGANWNEAYTELVTDSQGIMTTANKTDTWHVEAVDEAVTVPAGDFCAMKVGRSSVVEGGSGGSNKVYWFTRGVGKIKEQTTGANETEELVSFTP